jgi:hypothetical protein
VTFKTVSLATLTLDDEASFRHVGLYRDLKQIALDDALPFRIPAAKKHVAWARALFLNLTFWSAAEPSDVLTDAHLPADVLTHATWHHLARLAFKNEPVSADAMFFGEAIASAFDLYLVGRLLTNAPDSDFLATQVPAMAERASDAGLSDEAFEALLASMADAPERAFEDLRALLFDAASSLAQATDVDDATARLEAFEHHRFAPILHHYELSNWILYARAYAPNALGPHAAVRAVDAALRAAEDPVTWLEANWVAPRLRAR